MGRYTGSLARTVVKGMTAAAFLGAYLFTSSAQAESALPDSPTGVSTENGDTAAVQLGVKFQANVDGKIEGVRFYRTVGAGVRFRAALWSPTGAQLASGSGVRSTMPGYVVVKFASPIAVKANQTYTASYSAATGRYSYIGQGLSSQISKGNLRLLQAGGVYTYTSTLVRPTQVWNNSNYMVDVIFTAGTTTSPTPSPTATPAPTPNPTATPAPTPNPTPAPTPVAGTRDPYLQPFNSASFWNTPVGSGAIYQDASGAESRDMANASLGYRWIGANAMKFARTSSSDPVRTWTAESIARANGNWSYGSSNTFSVKTPDALQFLTVDGWSLMLEDNNRYFLETWLAERTSGSNVKVAYVVRNDIRGPGYDNVNKSHSGIRATGYSLLGGLVRQYDLDQGRIAHAIAMAISTRQANKGSVRNVWPAYFSDGGIAYEGSIPLGALFAIPANVNLDAIGLTTREGKMLARAFKEFGGYVSDTAGPSTNVIAYVETGVPQAQIDGLFADLDKIVPLLRRVMNNSEAAPGGPGTRIAAPPAPLAP